MKKNLPLIIGLAVPVLMIVFIAAAIYLPNLTAHPQYSFIYSARDPYNYNGYGDQYSVKDSKITKETINPPKPIPTPGYTPPEYPVTKTYLYIYDAASQTAKEITFEDAQKYTLNNNQTSPDGYSLEQGGRNAGIFDLFGGYDYSKGPEWYLRNGAANKKVNLQFPGSTSNYYYNSNFQLVGWILK